MHGVHPGTQNVERGRMAYSALVSVPNMDGRALRSALALCLLSLILSGCSAGDRPDESDLSSLKPFSENAAPYQVSGQMKSEVIATFGDPAYTNAENGGNCVSYSGAEVEYVYNAAVELIWNATLAEHNRLRLVIDSYAHPQIELRGESPLRLEVHNITVGAKLHFYVTSVSEPGAILKQPLVINWTMSYGGIPSLTSPTRFARCG
jgi:hypothetical protein